MSDVQLDISCSWELPASVSLLEVLTHLGEGAMADPTLHRVVFSVSFGLDRTAQ